MYFCIISYRLCHEITQNMRKKFRRIFWPSYFFSECARGDGWKKYFFNFKNKKLEKHLGNYSKVNSKIIFFILKKKPFLYDDQFFLRLIKNYMQSKHCRRNIS